MIPETWPRWSVIVIALALTLAITIVALILDPAAQAAVAAIVPATPAPTMVRLPYAKPQSQACETCHLDPANLQAAGASEADLARVFIDPAYLTSLHGQLGCVTCHAGNGAAATKEAAHEGRVANPSSYQDADTYCLPCHHSMRADIPEAYIHTPHSRIIEGVHTETEVCACSNCHGPVAHGTQPVGTHLMEYCQDCHVKRNVPADRLKCIGCHIGPHDVSAAVDCDVCHTSTQVWSKTTLAVHPMQLKGAHAQLACFECHTWPDFRDRKGWTCVSCHEMPHEAWGAGEYTDCSKCHQDGGQWNQVDATSFDHTTIWDYHQGAHKAVACRGCHLGGYEKMDPSCGSCHALNKETCHVEQTCTTCHQSDKTWSDVK